MAKLAQIVIFGASGDLTARKLIPALIQNYRDGAFSCEVQVIGVSRSEKTAEMWCSELEAWLDDDAKHAWADIRAQISWQRADAGDPAQIAELEAHLDSRASDAGFQPENTGRLFYLALAPFLFGPTVEALAKHGMVAQPSDAEGWRRVVVEKPFGTDGETAKRLNTTLLKWLEEEQIFRIDHYLGKETVQNILSLRFQNAIFEPLWNRHHVESVEISVCETVAMEGKRGAYYDKAGAIRDMMQNHVLQVLALVAMEPPSSMNADAIRSEKVKVLDALRTFSPSQVESHVVRAQYDASDHRDKAYRQEVGVAADSSTETYVAVRALVDTWRWSGVPFLLRTGKALDKRFTQVTLRFRTPPLDLLNGPIAGDACPLRPNDLQLLIQPEEGVRLGFLVKQPGPGMVMRPSDLGFDYADLDHGDTPEAYTRLLLDAIEGNPTLFIRGDEVEAAWRFVDAIRAGWEQAAPPMHTYPAGSHGPAAADALFQGCEGIWSRGP